MWWLAATDGGIVDYGRSGFFGSRRSLTLNSPVVGMVQTPDGPGYWLLAFGFHGGSPFTKPIVAMSGPPG